METIYRIDATGNFSGVTMEIEDDAGAPLGWVRAQPLEMAGKVASWMGLGWTLVDQPELPSEIDIVAAKVAAFEKRINQDTDAIYAAAIGHRGPEYEDAAREAEAFKEAGYSGPVPDSVSSWATPKNSTAQWAADDILASASTLTAAKKAIRAQRLAAKESARAALGGADQAPIDIAAAQWETFVIAIRAQLNL